MQNATTNKEMFVVVVFVWNKRQTANQYNFMLSGGIICNRFVKRF